MSHNITVEGGTSVRLVTAGKYCDRDIVITATGSATNPVIQSLTVTENGTYTATDGVDGYSPVTVNVTGEENQLHASLDGSLTKIDSDVKSVISYACRGLSKLTTVNIPNVTRIYTYAFHGCSALVSIDAKSVTQIDAYSFNGFSKLVSVNMPSLKSMNMNAFQDCTSLVKLDLPNFSSFSGTNHFNGASSLETLILRKSDSPVALPNVNTFTGTPIAGGTGYIYVPAALVDSYKTAARWSTYAEQIKPLSELEE